MEDLQRHRNLGKAYYERGEYSLAVSELEKTLASEAVSGRDYFNLGMAYLQDQQDDRALSAFTTAGQMEPGLIDVDFGLAVLHKRALRYPLALESFQKVAARDPQDPCTSYNVGAVLSSMRRVEEAEAAFRRVLDLGHARAQNFYVSALFRYATLLAQHGRREEAQELFPEFERLRKETPNVALTETALENGRYARVELPRSPAPTAREIEGSAEPDLVTEILATGCEDGLTLALGDYDADGRIDVFVTVRCGENRLLRNLDGGEFEDVTRASGLSGSRGGRGALFLDDENSGAPSLYVWGEAGHHLYRNRDGRFEDQSGSSGIAAAAAPTIALAQDFDNDGQLDLLLAGPEKRIEVLRNQGDGAFSRAGALEARGRPRGVAAADFNDDGFPDVFAVLESDEALLFENQGGAFRAPPVSVGRGLEGKGRTRVEVAEFDGDGWLDVVVLGEGATATFLNRRGRFHQDRTGIAPRDADALDLDGDGSIEKVVAGSDGVVRLFKPKKAESQRFLRVALEGRRTNRQATGATVELKAGRFYRKVIYSGHPVTLLTGDRERLDVVRVTWTNGVIQNLVDVPTGQNLRIEEDDRQTSSCPFLYVWDGRSFRFLTDVSGRAPLGEILPDGSVLTPHPEDYVRIPKGAMMEREGKLIFQITEELRELAYVDSVEILAIDRPDVVALYTNEKFSSPPFEPFRLYPVSTREPPVEATNGRGEDVLGLLRDSDGEYVSNFARDRVSGFAEEHALVLTPPATPEGSPLWLLLSGWVYWPSSSSMKALSSNERLTPRAPRLQVKDPAGEWVTAIEDLGLPSGIDRTLVADLSRVFLSPDRRVRVVTNFAVYWDQASFAEPASDAGISTRSLWPAAADLHYRGFSVVATEEGKPERYDYERLLPEAPWNAVSGRYTRYGDVASLTSRPDGRLAVMAPGDEMTLTFDADDLPVPAAGSERDYFLHVTGWAKDQDPNTRSSRTVDPLPEAARDGVDPLRTRRVAALVPPLSFSAAAEEEQKKSLTDSLTKGTPSVALRYRYELVDDGAFDREAHASTLRTVLGYRTLPYRGFSFFLQAQNVAAIGNDLFDNRGAGHLANGVSDRPAVSDPSQTRMQQVYGRLEAFDTTLDVGRREIAYGDHRFIGDVNWRQNHQAFDAIHLSNRSLPKTTLSYTFADKVIRIDGGTKDMSSHFVNALVALDPNLSLELFSYLLDYDAAVDAPLSSQSYGGKLSGRRPLLEKHQLLFEAQYGKQMDFGANPADRDADYLHLVGGVGLSRKLTLKLGRELLGGSPANGVFQTPLATLFKFNGWADKFLTTPPNGLVDWYVSGEGRLRSLGWIVAYHDFSADAGGDAYGSELDARAVFSTSWKQSFGAQLALYREDGFGTDTTKLWIWTEYSF
jgi:tetratricopeptide (TPR) repeat protein